MNLDIGKIKKIGIAEGKAPFKILEEENIINQHPFESFLGQAVSALNKTSHMETFADRKVEEYDAGKASLEEVMFAQQRATLQLNLTITALNNSLSTFKEIQQMPV
jgi:flagellar hook-basal body complex protein FliE